MESSTPPHYGNPEKGALGCVIIAGEAGGLFSKLKPDYFREKETSEIYASIERLLTSDQKVTVESLKFLHADTLEGVDIYDWAPTHLDFPRHLEALQKRANPWLELCEDAADIMVREIPPVNPIVENLLCPDAKLMLGGGSKSYKTWLTINLALCIAHGQPFLGWQTRRVRVLYANLELRPIAFDRRVQTLGKRLGFEIDREAMIHLPLRGKLSPDLATNIDRLIDAAEIYDAKVVVADPIYKLNHGDENAAHVQTALFNELDRLTAAGCAVIINDHFGKGNQSEKDPLDAVRGSSAKGGDVDAAMILRKHDVDDHFRVDIVHRELPPVDPFVMGWKFPLMRREDELNPQDMKQAKPGRKRSVSDGELLAAIADSTPESPISVSQWATAVGKSRSTVLPHIEALRTRGFVATTGDGASGRKYITSKGLEHLEGTQ